MNCGLFWIELCLVWVKKDNSLPCTALYTDFPESKKQRSKESKQKIFAAQTPPRKRGYEEDFAYHNKVRLRNLKNPRFALSTRLGCEIARRCYALLDNGVCTNSNYFGKSVIFYILRQSTGQTFLPSLPTAR